MDKSLQGVNHKELSPFSAWVCLPCLAPSLFCLFFVFVCFFNFFSLFFFFLRERERDGGGGYVRCMIRYRVFLFYGVLGVVKCR